MVLAQSNKLLQNKYIKNFRILKSEKDLETGLIQKAREELLERVAHLLADGRKYTIFFRSEVQELEYPEWTNFKDYNITLEIYLLDPKECKTGESFISNGLNVDINSIPSETEFKNIDYRDNQIIWRRVR